MVWREGNGSGFRIGINWKTGLYALCDCFLVHFCFSVQKYSNDPFAHPHTRINIINISQAGCHVKFHTILL